MQQYSLLIYAKLYERQVIFLGVGHEMNRSSYFSWAPRGFNFRSLMQSYIFLFPLKRGISKFDVRRFQEATVPPSGTKFRSRR